MMESHLVHLNELDMKKLVAIAQDSSSQQEKQPKFEGNSTTTAAAAAAVVNSVTSALSADDVHSLVGSHFVGHLNDNMQTTRGFNVQSSSSSSSTTNHINQPSTQIDINSILVENQKLAAIARVCIHLVDRCRIVNKSKQFTEDMNKLSNMIDDFNRNTSRHLTNSLPVINHSGGLVFANGTNGGNGSQISTAVTSTSNGGQANNKQLSLTNTGANMFLIPINADGHGSAHQSTTILQQYFSDDEHPNHKSSNNTETRNYHKTSKHSTNRKHHISDGEEMQQSILFKKLTESGQIIATELSGKESTSHTINHSNGSQMLAIPLQLNDHSNSFFSIVNQIDHSNIENTPSINVKSSKSYKCTVCSKVFVNSYNLNRHMKSHSGFQPYECIYQDCRKRFNYNYHLKRHMDTHTGERPFACTWPNCDQRFNRKYNLNRHLWIHIEHKNKQTVTI